MTRRAAKGESGAASSASFPLGTFSRRSYPERLTVSTSDLPKDTKSFFHGQESNR